MQKKISLVSQRPNNLKKKDRATMLPEGIKRMMEEESNFSKRTSVRHWEFPYSERSLCMQIDRIMNSYSIASFRVNISGRHTVPILCQDGRRRGL